MISSDIYITVPTLVLDNPLIEIVEEVCKKKDPPPLFCGLPEDLKLKSIENSGTIQTSTPTNSFRSVASGYGTSTTTTF